MSIRIVSGDYVVTMDCQCQVLNDAGLALEADRIVAVASREQLQQDFPEASQEHLAGCVLMPGLINCHTHVPMALFRGIADDKELMDWLNNYIFPIESKTLSPDFVRCGTRLAFWEMLRGGTTCVVDMYMFENVVAEVAAEVGMRGIFSQAVIDFPTPDFPNWTAAMAGVEEFVSRWSKHPLVVPAVGPHAPYTVSPEHLQECHAFAERLDCPVVIHLAETKAEHDMVLRDRGLSPVSYLHSLGLLSKRLITAHMVWPTEEEIPLLAQFKVGVGHCPQSNAKLASGIAPVYKMLRQGVAVGLGTDGCASNNDLDMWQEMQTAVFLQKLANNDATILTARESLELMTCRAAQAAHLDHLIGSLEVGKQADFIVVRVDQPHQRPLYDVISQLVYATKASDVCQVTVAGRTLVQGNLMQTIDEKSLIAEIDEQAAKVRRLMKA